MTNTKRVRLILTQRQAEALLTIAVEAQAGAYYEGEMFNCKASAIRSADRAIKELRRVVEGIE